jgi:hypothetical protein
MSLLDDNLDIKPIDLLISICKKYLLMQLPDYYREIINDNIEIIIERNVIERYLIKRPKKYVLLYKTYEKCIKCRICHKNDIKTILPGYGGWFRYLSIDDVLKYINHELA